MSRILATVGALALAATLALPAASKAAERKADGLRDAAGVTEVSSVHRRWHRRHCVAYRPYWRGGPYAYGYIGPPPGPIVGDPIWRSYYRPMYGSYLPWYRPWYGPFGWGW